MNVLEMYGPDFLVFFVIVGGVGLLLAYVLRRILLVPRDGLAAFGKNVFPNLRAPRPRAAIGRFRAHGAPGGSPPEGFAQQW
ncbi:MAG: hypothetical protein MJE77_04410 [Proteobacteria bacterium]|nr:hypothetical protein [Pseudomonadota bacterium]